MIDEADLIALRSRGVLNPNRFYKKSATVKNPTSLQVGTIIEGPHEYYSSRLTKKQRKRTFIEELMSDRDQMHLINTKAQKLKEKRDKIIQQKRKFNS